MKYLKAIFVGLHNCSSIVVYFCSFGLGILVALAPDGITVGGVPLDIDTTMGTINLYKGVEGVFESMPQAIYQASNALRTPGEEISMYKV